MLLLALWLRLLASPSSDLDIWGRLAEGKLVLATWSIPTVDPFAYTEVVFPWVYHEWLSAVVFFWLYSTLTPLSLYLLKAGIGLLVLVIFIKRSADLSLWRLVVLCLCLSLMGRGFGMRPQVFTYGLFTLTLLILERVWTTGNTRWTYSLPILAIPWANLHGGFLACPAIIGCYATERRMWKSCLVAAPLSCIASAIHPIGIEYWNYMYRLLTVSRTPVSEWAPVYRHFPSAFAYFLLLAIAAACVARNRDQVSTPQLACLLGTSVAAFLQMRHAPLFAIVVAMTIPRIKWEELDRLRLSVAPYMMLLASIVLLAFLAIVTAAYQYFDPASMRLRWTSELNELDFPVGAVGYIRSRGLKGNMAVSFEVGEYCTWKLWPGMKISFDGRYEIYADKVHEEYLWFRAGDPRGVRYLTGADFALVDLSTGSYQLMLALRPKWVVLHEDGGYALFQRAQSTAAGRVEKISKAEGLPSPTVRHAIRPSDGSIWA
ncbi:MAG: hypothetical protein AB1714_31430 [Acidobacteriota bacterium]